MEEIIIGIIIMGMGMGTLNMKKLLWTLLLLPILTTGTEEVIIGIIVMDMDMGAR